MTDPGTPLPFQGSTDGLRMEPREIRVRRAVVTLVLLIGLVATGAGAWAAWTQNRDATASILRVQTNQAGEVLVAAIPSVVSPLNAAGELAANSQDAVTVFESYLRPFVAAPTGFKDASLWSLQAHSVSEIASIGSRPDLAPSSRGALALSRRAAPCSVSFAIMEVRGAGTPRFGYACSVASGPRTYIVYAERLLPANQRGSVAKSSAFSELRYAIYFGKSTRNADLIATDFSTLPPSGVSSKVSVPFGDSWLTLVTAPNGSLAGSLSENLPWLIAAAGMLLTLLAALITRSLVRGRQEAEHVSRETLGLNVEISRLLAEQQAIAETLQRSLLPAGIPAIPGVEIEARYVPGSDKLEVGGDWYSVVRIDEGHFGFVVGDVSGHGIQAAAVMAALRFTIRTLILEGYSPDVVLDRCTAQIRDLLRGHFATVLVVVADLTSRKLVMANAGHLNPLLVSDAGSSYLETSVGVPIGVPQDSYELSSVVMPHGATLFAFTDGLVERRGESLDIGLERLRSLTKEVPTDLDVLLTAIVDKTRSDGDSEDDLALLALRWH